jgi:dTDP-4-dehydrorhamnose reductase
LKKVAILGKRGRLGAALCRLLVEDYEVLALGREDVDLSLPLAPQLAGLRCDAVINAAAACQVDWCEANPGLAERINSFAPGELGEWSATSGCRCLHISTDYVFDGLAEQPYTEEGATNPVDHYGRTKLAGERALLERSPNSLVVRVSWLFGPDKPSFPDTMIERAIREDQVTAISDKYSVPTYTLDCTRWLRLLLFDQQFHGAIHLCNREGCSWHQYASFVLETAKKAGLPLKTIQPKEISLSSMSQFIAKRPPYTVMSTSKFTALTGITPRSWREAIIEYVGKTSIERKRGSSENGAWNGGCLVLLFACFLVILALAWGAISTYQGAYQMTSPSPRVFEPVPSSTEVEAFHQKIQGIKDSISRREETEFRFSANDLNAWFFGEGRNTDLADHLRFRTEADWLVVDLSVPLTFMADVPFLPSIRSRYFDGRMAGRLVVEKGELKIQSIDLEGNGKRLPWLFTGQSYKQTITDAMNQGIQTRLPEGDQFLHRIESIRVENNEIILKLGPSG